MQAQARRTPCRRSVLGPLAGDPAGGDRIWQVVANWNGAAGIRCEGNDTEIGIDVCSRKIVVPAWGARLRGSSR
jgi:hypothetical protein